MAFSRAAGHPIGVGIVGLSASGQWAANAHVPALRAIEGYELRALSASSAESAAAAGRAHDVPLSQVAVNARLPSAGGTLAGGAVASFHYRGGLNRGTNFHWEINGTEGDLVVTAPYGHLQLVPITVHGARGTDTELTELAVPAEYQLVPELPPEHPGYAVAHAYAQLLQDERTGQTTVPDFDHAVLRHPSIAAIEQATTR